MRRPPVPTFVPYFAYQDAAAAIDWLESAFGFAVTRRIDGEDGALVHAELRFGDDGLLMVGSATVEHAPVDRPSSYGIYARVEDVDAHHDRAKAAGAEIVLDPEDTEWGARQYRVLDLDGYEWTFGSYASDR
ncbi:MAG TPA: VOC family protein [Solirubrobacteraceae bacterium]